MSGFCHFEHSVISLSMYIYRIREAVKKLKLMWFLVFTLRPEQVFNLCACVCDGKVNLLARYLINGIRVSF